VLSGSWIFLLAKARAGARRKYLNVWKKEGGTWKIYSNIWNANAPAAAAR
jgi:ketosteroid isomerase-like protein